MNVMSQEDLIHGGIQLIILLVCFFRIVALDRNLGLGYNILLLQLIPGDLLRACPHTVPHTTQPFRQSASTVKLLPFRLCAKQGGILYYFYDSLW